MHICTVPSLYCILHRIRCNYSLAYYSCELATEYTQHPRDLPIICEISIDRGAISGIQVSLISFLSDPPTFTLLGATSGGPPTTYTWTRNGQVITNSASYSISIQVERSNAGFQNIRYRSTLTVTGRLPGVYQYSVTS